MDSPTGIGPLDSYLSKIEDLAHHFLEITPQDSNHGFFADMAYFSF